MVDLGGARTGLAIVLLQSEQLRGAIMIYRQEVRSFTELCRTSRHRAVIAMGNVRLLDELRQRTDEEQVEDLGQVGRLKRFSRRSSSN